MKRRMLLVGLTSALFLGGCAGPVTQGSSTAPLSAFTTDGAREALSGMKTLKEVIDFYGEPERSVRPKNADGQWRKGFVFEWYGTRPSFPIEPEKIDPSYLTPTVKRELTVWVNREKEVVGHRLSGVSYLQVKRPGLQMIMRDFRALTSDELAGVRIPIAVLENVEAVNAYYAKLGVK